VSIKCVPHRINRLFYWAQFKQDREAERSLPARDLDAEPALQAALLAVYRAGKTSDAKGLGG
jgi:hypothetical protein